MYFLDDCPLNLSRRGQPVWSTLVIRALAVGELKLTDLWRVIRREVFAGVALGAILGTIGFLRISIWSLFSDLYGPHWLLMAVTVSLSPIRVVPWGRLVGSDPAVHPEAARVRPGGVVGAVRRHAGECDRADHLFHRWTHCAPQHAAVRVEK
jgi:hypothetical protein